LIHFLRRESSREAPARQGLLGRLGKALSKTRSAIADGIAQIIGARATIDDALLEDVETILLTADVGVEATRRIMDGLAARVSRSEVGDVTALLASLEMDMLEILERVEAPLAIPASDAPYVILVVGVNGAGKTTTIGKLAARLGADGRSVLVAAGDTFRAAAIEQLQEWGDRAGVPVVAQQPGADSASVIYDAFEAARARGIDVLIADTAGRLHTRVGLMDELRKVRRVIGKLDASAPHEVLLVLDAGTGQNALTQAVQFHDAVGVTGIALTKLDGTAKGGIVFAIAERLGLPIRLVGVGEGVDDLRDFDARTFVAAIVGR
jgi:fused signal recognition particle receptor